MPRPFAKERRCPPSRFARFRTARLADPRHPRLPPAGLRALRQRARNNQVLVWMGLGALLIFIGVSLFAARLVRSARGRHPAPSPNGRSSSPDCSSIRSRWRPGSSATGCSAVAAPGPPAPRDRACDPPARRAGRSARRRTLAAGSLDPPRGGRDSCCQRRRRVLDLANRALEGRTGLADRPSARTGVSTEPVARGQLAAEPAAHRSTASALMIGLALVTLVATLAAGITNTFRGAVDKIFTSDYAITAQNILADPHPRRRRSGETPRRGDREHPHRRGPRLRLDRVLTAVDPTAGEVTALDGVEGSHDVFRDRADGAFVDEATRRITGSTSAADHGDRPLGERLELKVKGIFDPPAGGSLFGAVTSRARPSTASTTRRGTSTP